MVFKFTYLNNNNSNASVFYINLISSLKMTLTGSKHVEVRRRQLFVTILYTSWYLSKFTWLIRIKGDTLPEYHSITEYWCMKTNFRAFLNFALHTLPVLPPYTWTHIPQYSLYRRESVQQNWSSHDGEDKFVPMRIEPQPYNPYPVTVRTSSLYGDSVWEIKYKFYCTDSLWFVRPFSYQRLPIRSTS